MGLLLLMIGVYFAPALVAVVRGHHNSAAIFVFNLFLAWTFLGWVIALVWSFMAVRPLPTQASAPPSIPPVDSPSQRAVVPPPVPRLSAKPTAPPKAAFAGWRWLGVPVGAVVAVALIFGAFESGRRWAPIESTDVGAMTVTQVAVSPNRSAMIVNTRTTPKISTTSWTTTVSPTQRPAAR